MLQLWIDRIRTLRVEALWLSSDTRDESVLRERYAELSQQGVERLLVVKLKSYAEMDLNDLLRFHCDKQNSVTDAQDTRGPLGVRVLDRSALHAANRTVPSLCPAPDRSISPYQFHGYTRRILASQERQDLVADGLTGGCAMRPAADQIDRQVWIGKDARVDPSARILGPAYIGARTIIHAGATIGPFVSIEQDCIVDPGTTIEHSSIFPRTHLAAGLLIRRSLVDGNCLEHLGWQTVVDLAPAGLGRRKARAIFDRRSQGWGSSVKNPVSECERLIGLKLIKPLADGSWTRVAL